MGYVLVVTQQRQHGTHSQCLVGSVLGNVTMPYCDSRARVFRVLKMLGSIALDAVQL